MKRRARQVSRGVWERGLSSDEAQRERKRETETDTYRLTETYRHTDRSEPVSMSRAYDRTETRGTERLAKWSSSIRHSRSLSEYTVLCTQTHARALSLSHTHTHTHTHTKNVSNPAVKFARKS